jgi:hypothetical protein
MDVASREIGGRLVLEFEGSFPRSSTGHAEVTSLVANACRDRAHVHGIVFVLPPVHAITSRDVTLVVGCLVTARKQLGSSELDSLQLVAESRTVREVFRFCGSPFSTHSTIEAALES